MNRYFVCLILPFIQSAHPQSTDTPGTTPKNYESEATGVCAGGYYELGCGVADGTKVMNVTQLNLVLDNEQGAFPCSTGGLCHIQMGGEYGDVVTAQPLLNLFRSIQANCHGKPMCTGTLPPYSDVAVYLPEGSYFHVCGWNIPEYLSNLNIVSRCQDAGTVEILPPYEYEKPTAQVTTTTQAPTATTVPVVQTTTPTTTITPEPTTKPQQKTTKTEDGKGNTGKQTGEQTDTQQSDIWIVFVVIGVVVGIAAVAGLTITIWVLCKKSHSEKLRSNSPSEHPLNEKGLPLDDSHPVTT